MAFLDEFKKKSSLATPTLLYVFFEELLKTKDICLVRGDLVDGYLTHKEADDLFQ
jgi:ATP11 protein